MGNLVVLEQVARYNVRCGAGGYSVAERDGPEADRYLDRVVDWVATISGTQTPGLTEGAEGEALAINDGRLVQLRCKPDPDHRSLKVFDVGLWDLRTGQKKLYGWLPWILRVSVGFLIIVASVICTWMFLVWLKSANPEWYRKFGLAIEPARGTVEGEGVPKSLAELLDQFEKLDGEPAKDRVTQCLNKLDELARKALDSRADDNATLYIDARYWRGQGTDSMACKVYADDWLRYSEYREKGQKVLEVWKNLQATQKSKEEK